MFSVILMVQLTTILAALGILPDKYLHAPWSDCIKTPIDSKNGDQILHTLGCLYLASQTSTSCSPVQLFTPTKVATVNLEWQIAWSFHLGNLVLHMSYQLSHFASGEIGTFLIGALTWSMADVCI
jgi:hypothetical protein